MIPNIEGTVYSLYQNESGHNPILSPGTYVDPYTTVEESCNEGYYKINPKSIKFCDKSGHLIPNQDKLCLSKYVFLFIVYLLIFVQMKICNISIC